LIINGGPENKALVNEFIKRYRVRRIRVSTYHPQTNGMVKRGHKPVINTLSKITDEDLGNWINNLHTILWANRVTIRRLTDQIPFYLSCGRQPVLPIELNIPT